MQNFVLLNFNSFNADIELVFIKFVAKKKILINNQFADGYG